MTNLWVGVALAFVLALHGVAQTPTLPAFDVASIKPTKIDRLSLFQVLPGGRFRATNFTLGGLITRAWRVQPDQLDGGPDWMRSEGYDIEARAAADAPADQVWLMLRALLTDRCNLSIQIETKERPVYELTMARKDRSLGPSLRPFAESNCTRSAPGGQIVPLTLETLSQRGTTNPDRPPCGMLRSPVGHWVGRETTIDSLAFALTRAVGRVVLNRTALTGTFDLDLVWTDLAQVIEPGADARPPADGPSLMTALQEQLGLRLDSRTGPVDVLVVKHVERPTPD